MGPHGVPERAGIAVVSALWLERSLPQKSGKPRSIEHVRPALRQQVGTLVAVRVYLSFPPV